MTQKVKTMKFRHRLKGLRNINYLVHSLIVKILILLKKMVAIVVSMQTIPSTFIRSVEEEYHEIPDKVVYCTILTEPNEVLVDVIFIHGLDGAMSRTWKQGTWDINEREETVFSKVCENISRKQHQKNTEVDDFSDCWPKNWISQDCKSARIITIDYITGWLWCPPFIKEREGNNMLNRSNEMIKELMKLGVGKRPIVWVGHSKGGLYIKQIIVNAWETKQTQEKGLFTHSKAIFWYGVPHRGSTLSNYTLPLLRRSVPLLETAENCDVLLDLHRNFLRIIEKENKDIEILSFVETRSTPVAPFLYWRIVSLESAEANIGRKYLVNVNHSNICKPRGRHCYLYMELLKAIKKLTDQN